MAPPVNPFKFNAKKDFRVHSRAKSSNPQDTGSQIDSFREEGHASIAEGRGSSPHSGTIETIPPTPPPKSSRTPVGLFRKWSRSSERVKDIAPSIHDDPDDYDDGHDRGRPTIDSETGFQMVQVPPSRPVKDPQARNFNPLRLLRTRSREKQDDPIFTETQRDSGGAPVFAESPTDIHTRELPAPPSSSKGKNPLALFRKKPRESKPEDAEDSAPRKGWPERALDITWSGAPGDPAQPSRPSGESRGINPLRLFRTKSREQDPAPADSLGDDGGPGLAEDVVEEATNPLRRSKSRGANPLRLFRSKSREQEPPESPRDSVREQLQPAEDQFEHGEETAKPLTRKGSFGRNIFGAFSRSKPPEEEPSHSLRDEDPEGGLIPPEHQIEHIEGSAKPARKGSLRRNLFGGLFSSEQHERDTAPIVDTSREEAQTPGDQYQPESSADVEEHEIPLRPTRSRGLNPLGLFRSKSREQDVPIHDDIQDDEGHGITEDESRLENLLNVDDPIDSTRPRVLEVVIRLLYSGRNRVNRIPLSLKPLEIRR
ncbi:hypothetical protein BS47DRAFT_317693 [Hydnum rufescens UP504]|uniref:Uncharacterized protein n=1 Tax=Hydnum rufescens UP504 TaxID=1448309 RepID=A0A9P6DQG3_9AGAM|nr:hypothetical protein BS47DRAFT_317693 [Hydnum rufescens UP504]